MLSRGASVAASAATLVLLAGSQAEAQEPRRPLGNLIGLFSQLDANGDQMLDRGEVPAEGLDAFDTLLKHGDSNDDDRLETSEFRSLIQRLQNLSPTPTPSRSAALFRSRDRDKDGVLGRDEFPGPAPLFDRLDADKSGRLSPKELQRARKAGGPGTRPPLRPSPSGSDGGRMPRRDA